MGGARVSSRFTAFSGYNARRSVLVALLVLMAAALVAIPAGAGSVQCAGQPATMVGGEGNNEIDGTPERDVIHALGGNDEVDGHGGNDVICGGAGRDSLSGDAGEDEVRGGRGDDEIDGNGGVDRLRGGRGTDDIDGGAGEDQCSGGEHVEEC